MKKRGQARSDDAVPAQDELDELVEGPLSERRHSNLENLRAAPPRKIIAIWQVISYRLSSLRLAFKGGITKLIFGLRMTLEQNTNSVIIKLDLRNAYNAIARAVVLRRLAAQPALMVLQWCCLLLTHPTLAPPAVMARDFIFFGSDFGRVATRSGEGCDALVDIAKSRNTRALAPRCTKDLRGLRD